ncbi:oxygenase MpaB family protein [Microbacterium sp.]|uniref:oxygenase MpaB family protein n=1 Tax=Microbacterium sp. TaxID=51671 RepID=UPI002E31FC05|nr:oxygenase MpaB family protein [Microbacterium sp.]HEX5730420.1 oxygenase MpaB family protein [Microbacterium sp.]
MAQVRDRWRSHLLQTLSGTDDGSPQWVRELARGDDAGFFGPGSASWAVHGGMATMVAGIRALLVQALHPGAMAGVHDWSRYREDPLGRLAGTIRWLMTVTFGDRAAAERSSAMVRSLHRRVEGEYVDAFGAPSTYRASDPELIEWVHLAFTDSFLTCHEIWEAEIPGGPDAYVREWASAGALVGVADPPTTAAELRGRIRAVADAGILKTDARVLDVVRFIRRPPLAKGMIPAYRIMFAGAVTSLDPEHRRMLGLNAFPLLPVPATGAVLRTARSLLGERSTSEEAALDRIARLQRESLLS